MSSQDPNELRTAEELRLALVQLAGSRRKVRSVARDTGLSPSTISELFAGKRRVTRRALVAIVGAYAPADLGRWMTAWLRVADEPPPPAGATALPRELPADLPVLVGREEELAALDELLTVPTPTSAPGLVAIAGTAGVGKTALAVHWGHLRQDRFPDGSLYVDLRGYDPSAPPMEPVAALAALLRSLGVEDADQPSEAEERAVRYRSLLAARRMLVVLDNAANSEQVRLLLPGASPGVTLITGREGLGSLRDRHGARQLELKALSPAASRRLLRELLGGAAVMDRTAVEAVVRHCAGLPLAVRIAAGLAADRQGGLAAVAHDLADDRARLDLLDAGDPRAAVRSVLSWSFSNVSDGVIRAFGLVGTSPCPDVDVYVAAALLGVSVASARQLVTALLRARLLQERRPGRVGMHDLLRDYARERAGATDRLGEVDAAAVRLRSYYLHGAESAARTVGLGPTEPVALGPAPELPALDTAEQAMAWFDAERPGMLAMVEVAVREGHWEWVCHLGAVVWRVLLARGFHVDCIRLHEAASRGARELGRPDWEVRALEGLGIAEQMVGRYADSESHIGQAVDASRRSGDRVAEARTLGSLGTVHARRGEHEAAIQLLSQGLRVAESIGAELVQARTHNNIGLVYQRWGRYELALEPLDRAVGMARGLGETQVLATALNNRSLVLRRLDRLDHARTDIVEARRLGEQIGDRSLLRQVLDSHGTLLLDDGDARAALRPLRQALAMHVEAGDRAAQAETLDNLGLALQRLGRPAEAVARHEEAVDIAEAIGDRTRVTSALVGIGDAYRQLGRPEWAARHLTTALEIARQLDNAELRARAMRGLAGLDTGQGTATGEPRR